MENLWAKIGETAGKVYHLLESGEKCLSEIEKRLKEEGYNTNIVKMAIGWLAREDKIEILKDNKRWIIRLKR
ncbi:winged helix-turn-helix domain-containing protein [Methanocaldococcus indicus]|uniref:winged helix-turn-helix domain-containing protein n=1 Tax=Methanocaldococcus indicus TaxID=213231 RepID=UPI003C6D91E1